VTTQEILLSSYFCLCSFFSYFEGSSRPPPPSRVVLVRLFSFFFLFAPLQFLLGVFTLLSLSHSLRAPDLKFLSDFPLQPPCLIDHLKCAFFLSSFFARGKSSPSDCFSLAKEGIALLVSLFIRAVLFPLFTSISLLSPFPRRPPSWYSFQEEAGADWSGVSFLDFFHGTLLRSQPSPMALRKASFGMD